MISVQSNSINRIGIKPGFNLDMILSIGLFVYFTYTLFTYGLYAITIQCGKAAYEASKVICRGSALFFVLLSVVISFYRCIKECFVTYITCAVLFLFSWYLNENNRVPLIAIAKDLFLFVIPIFLMVLSLKTYEYLFKMMSKASYVLILFGFLYTYYGGISVEYSMTFGYVMVLPILFSIYNVCSNNHTLLNVVFAICGIILVIKYGSRGPLLIFAVYGAFAIICYLAKGDKNNWGNISNNISIFGRKYKLKVVFLFVVILVFILIIALFFNQIMDHLYVNSLNHNFNSRTLRVLATKGIAYSSGRDLIANIAIKYIISNNCLGAGMAGDRYIIAEGTNSIDEIEGDYCHNILLELIVQYGVVIGGILILLLFCLIYKKIANISIYSYEGIVFFVFLSYAFIRSMISGSYLIDYQMWVVLAISINKFHKTKDEVNV